MERLVNKSIYVEDSLLYWGGHTSVWGSYFTDGKWGYPQHGGSLDP